MLGLWNGEKLAATAYKYKDGVEDAFLVKIFIKAGDGVMDIPKRKMHGRDTFLRWRMYSYADTGDDNAPDDSGRCYRYDFPKKAVTG